MQINEVLNALLSDEFNDHKFGECGTGAKKLWRSGRKDKYPAWRIKTNIMSTGIKVKKKKSAVRLFVRIPRML